MSIDMGWFTSQVEAFTSVRPRYEAYAQTLENLFKSATRELGPTILQSRAKTIASFAEKALRKRHKYHDPVNQLTDLCGARVIVHLAADVAQVSRFIRETFDIDEANSLDTAERLQASEFGYRSVHYVVTLRHGPFPFPEISLEVPESVVGLKAEIQVRTIAQHAWADIGHDRIYKGAFQAPPPIARDSARAAALLEDVDDAFSRLVDRIDVYRASYGAYMDADTMREEREVLQAVLQFDPNNEDIAHGIDWLLSRSLNNRCASSPSGIRPRHKSWMHFRWIARYRYPSCASGNWSAWMSGPAFAGSWSVSSRVPVTFIS